MISKIHEIMRYDGEKPDVGSQFSSLDSSLLVSCAPRPARRGTTREGEGLRMAPIPRALVAALAIACIFGTSGATSKEASISSVPSVLRNGVSNAMEKITSCLSSGGRGGRPSPLASCLRLPPCCFMGCVACNTQMPPLPRRSPCRCENESDMYGGMPSLCLSLLEGAGGGRGKRWQRRTIKWNSIIPMRTSDHPNPALPCSRFPNPTASH